MRKVQDFNGSTLLYLVKSRKIKLDLSKKYMLIPFKIDYSISFVPITTKQYDELLMNYKKFGSLTINQYQERLTKYLFENGEEMIVVVCLNNKVHTGGFLVALFESEDDILHHDITYISDCGENIYSMALQSLPTDFDLPRGTVSIFRGYSWPFINCVKETYFDLMQRTYQSKGLVRHCTKHYGNFEMIGERRSYQSNGSLIVDPEYVMEHQYYRETMDSSLLPYVKIIINSLQEEAIQSSYKYGESLMSLYKKVLKIRNEKELCKQTIITQNNFHNSIHKDKGSALEREYNDRVMNSDYFNDRKHVEEKRYLMNIMKLSGGKLPKSTTCCWTLRKDNPNFIMKQYFVGVDGMFAYDLSSDVLKNENNAGATFMSSLFFHLTSVPIWIDVRNNIHLRGPENMYNFAWGSDGGSASKRKK